jgi:predicted nucleic acid-binding protein
MTALFIDAGPLVAVANPGDQYEAEARGAWQLLTADARQLVSSEHVLDEVATAISRAQGPGRAAAWVRSQFDSGLVRWLPTRPGELRTAADWLEKYADQRISFTDAVSFVVMRREGIAEAFTFDRHFAIAGFRRWPADSR